MKAAGVLTPLCRSDSLQLVAVYGLVSCLALLVLGNALGRLVDTRPRDVMIKSAILTQNIAVSITCVVLALHFGVGLMLSIDRDRQSVLVGGICIKVQLDALDLLRCCVALHRLLPLLCGGQDLSGEGLDCLSV